MFNHQNRAGAGAIPHESFPVEKEKRDYRLSQLQVPGPARFSLLRCLRPSNPRATFLQQMQPAPCTGYQFLRVLWNTGRGNKAARGAQTCR